jgi:hypothetical protein
MTITNQTCYDVLTTALEGGYAEEFLVLDHKRAGADQGHVLLWAKVTCSEGYEQEPLEDQDRHLVLDPDRIRTGFSRYTTWVRENDPDHRTYLGEQWAIAHDPEGTGWDEVDAIGADAVLQFAVFGEVIFG